MRGDELMCTEVRVVRGDDASLSHRGWGGVGTNPISVLTSVLTPGYMISVCALAAQ